MRKTAVKAAFHLSTVFVMLILMVPAYLFTETVFPDRPGPDGIYRGNDRMFAGFFATTAAICGANWLCSYLFWKTGLSDERWSVFRSR